MPTDTEAPSVLQLRTEAAELGSKIRDLRAIPRDKRTDEQNNEIRSTTIELTALDAEATAAEHLEQRTWREIEMWNQLLDDANTDTRPDSRGPQVANDRLGGGFRSFGAEIVESDAYKAWAKDGGERMPTIEFEGRSLAHEFRTLLDSVVDGSGDAGTFIPPRAPIAPVPRQQNFFLRDLLPTVQTGIANSVPYIRELNPATNETGASSVAEGVAKPEAVMEFLEVSAPVRKLAVWIPATEEILADAPTLRGYINTRLAYMLNVREQQQILTGNGIAPDLTGILVTSGIQTVTTATNGDPFKDFTEALGKLENVDGSGDGIAMNPIDYWTTIGLRHSTWFDGNIANSGGAPFGGPPGTLWGLPVVRSRALTTLTAVVADWSMGAAIFDRMQTTIRQSDSHSDYFVLNKIAVLAEERIALPVFRPDFFVKVTIDITP